MAYGLCLIEKCWPTSTPGNWTCDFQSLVIPKRQKEIVNISCWKTSPRVKYWVLKEQLKKGNSASSESLCISQTQVSSRASSVQSGLYHQCSGFSFSWPLKTSAADRLCRNFLKITSPVPMAARQAMHIITRPTTKVISEANEVLWSKLEVVILMFFCSLTFVLLSLAFCA